QAKTLVWGVLTDDKAKMTISLRDFRPHVGPMQAENYHELARDLAQDYLDAYIDTLDTFVEAVGRMAIAEDEMHWGV
ncbi:MAG: hypothetical protein GYB68_17500, partial [Chloroflexi bacterium]|nr:hypothetical protein [Chloroflexota bacterium]